VNQVTRSRNLLLVDDSFSFQDQDERVEDARWRTTIDSLQARRPFDFDPIRDIYDVVDNHQEPPPLSLVFDYKTVVWTTRSGPNGTALRTLAVFFDPFVPQNVGQVVAFNYLNIYVDNGGEFWLTGAQPTDVLWDFGRGAPLRPYPINVTNWDDYMFMHPDQDSVGVASLLWKLGAEAVDIGSGGRGDRESLDQNCIGFKRAEPQGSTSQTFTTDVVLDHSHALEVPTDAVNNPPVGGVTLTTKPSQGHTHDVFLSRDQLKTLQRGGTLKDVALSMSPLPSPHSHKVTLCDLTGLWGATARLDPERGLWAIPVEQDVNPLGGRPNVEIYNMGPFMARQQPPLQPDPRVWRTLYTYASSTPSDSVTFYPNTADGQPAVILRKATPVDRYFSRCMCGFEPHRLRPASFLALADNILLRQFRLGLPDSP